MEVLTDPWQWAELHFGTATLSDQRRTRRLVHAAARLAAHPPQPFPQVLDWNQPRGENTHQRKRRPRESDLWPNGFRAVGSPPPECCWVDVCDRGSDDYEAMRQARELGHHFLFRVGQERLVFVTEAQDRQEYLLE